MTLINKIRRHYTALIISASVILLIFGITTDFSSAGIIVRNALLASTIFVFSSYGYLGSTTDDDSPEELVEAM